MKKIVYLPLDERPCNYEFAKRIADCANGYELVRPDKELLGKKKIPASYENIDKFLFDSVKDSVACVLSLEMLLYGGLLPSRLHHHSVTEILSRLEILKKIKELNPEIKIYAFALIMRCPSYSTNDEEPDYYGECGEEIFLTGQAKHKAELGLISKAEEEALLKKYAEKTNGYLQDYETRRETNRQALIGIIEEVGKTIDFLVVPQDDSAEYGYTTKDREFLKSVIREKGLKSVDMYPGADEVGMSLTCRAICVEEGKTPKIYPCYTAPGGENVYPPYEDRPVGQTLPHQISTAGCETVDDESKADIILYMNYPLFDAVMIRKAPCHNEGYLMRNLPNFVKKIASSVKAGKTVGIADGAYCNGGDIEFMLLLQKEISLFDLSSYSGWNTSSNSLGTAIFQAVTCFLFGKNERQNKFLAERYYEDLGYCSHTRSYMMWEYLPKTEKYGGENVDEVNDAGEVNGEVAKWVRDDLSKYMSEAFPEVASRYTLDRCQLPWARMFEVDLSLKKV